MPGLGVATVIDPSACLLAALVDVELEVDPVNLAHLRTS